MQKAILISCLILQLTALFINAQDTDELKTVFEFHNKVRRSALSGEIPNQPKAKEMPELTWNDKLADLAQQHVDKCVLEKSNLDEVIIGKYDKVGQTVAEHESVQKILDTWYNEHKEYKFDQNECSSECGSYKQIVWAATKEIGCGYKLCGKKATVVCNYAPGAEEGKPYEKA
ncbi:unnamed protein product [Trichobilharzia szidati]|nr:unnamed protein product [Trichobilharzia szidati]